MRTVALRIVGHKMRNFYTLLRENTGTCTKHKTSAKFKKKPLKHVVSV